MPVKGARGVEFVYIAKVHVQSVSVAGTFNSWNHQVDYMQKTGEHCWELERSNSKGSLYKFVVNGVVRNGSEKRSFTSFTLGHSMKTALLDLRRMRWLKEKELSRVVEYLGPQLAKPAATMLMTVEGVPFILVIVSFSEAPLVLRFEEKGIADRIAGAAKQVVYRSGDFNSGNEHHAPDWRIQPYESLIYRIQ